MLSHLVDHSYEHPILTVSDAISPARTIMPMMTE